MIVSNSSPIIILGKQGRLDLLRKCFREVIIPKRVYEEVAVKKGEPEVIALEEAAREKWLVVEKIRANKILDTGNIGEGEKEAISLAEKHKAILLTDDDSAKAYASILGVEAHGTLYAIYLSCMRKLITKDESIEILKRMIKDGFYISTDVYAKFIELLLTKGETE